MKRFVPIIMMLAAFTGGCKQSRNEEEGSDAKIFGGEAVLPGDPIELFTAALTKPNGAVMCTATLISPNVLVTAAHCLVPEIVDGGLNVTFGLETKSGLSVPIKAYTQHPRFDPKNEGSATKAQYDIGLVALQDPQAGRSPIPILDSEFPLEPYASTLKIAGYGFTDIGKKDIGVLRSALTNFSSELLSKKEIIIDGFRVTNACSGDSGGPAMIRYDGQIHVLGAASYIISMSGRVCSSGYSAYTDLRAHRAWINQMIMQLPQQTGKVESSVPKQAAPQGPLAAPAPAPSPEPTDTAKQASNSEASGSEVAQ